MKKQIIKKGKKYKKNGEYKDAEYVQSRLDEFVNNHKEEWRWRDYSDFFGQSACGTIRNWYIDGIPANQLFFVHLVLEKHNY